MNGAGDRDWWARSLLEGAGYIVKSPVRKPGAIWKVIERQRPGRVGSGDVLGFSSQKRQPDK